MSDRSWRAVVLAAIVATAVIGVAGGLDFVSNVIRPQKTVECQDSPECRAFIEKAVADAITTRGGKGTTTAGDETSAPGQAGGGGSGSTPVRTTPEPGGHRGHDGQNPSGPVLIIPDNPAPNLPGPGGGGLLPPITVPPVCVGTICTPGISVG